MSWLVPPDELTSDQRRIVELPVGQHWCVLGAPGSGKTLALLYRAQSLIDRALVVPDRMHIFVFTNVLKQYIRNALEELGLPEGSVTTLDDWCKSYFERHLPGRIPRDRQQIPDFGAIRKAVLNKVRGSQPLYDAILVDEGQDLDGECLDIVLSISRHVTVCVDHKQQVYDHGSTEQEIVRRLGLKRSNITLLDAFRCCPYIVRIAAEYIADSSERAAFLNQSRTEQMEKQTPLLYEAADFEDERRRLIEIVRERQVVDRSIAILFPLRKQVAGFAHGLREAGIEVDTWDRWRRTPMSFSNGVPKVLTFHSAKGLTFDTVLLPRLVPNSFPMVSSPRLEKLMYVGITRATKWVYLSTIKGRGIDALNRLRKLAEMDDAPIGVQSWDEKGMSAVPSIGPTTSPATDSGDQESDDLLDLL
jgi:superfamily I DNA/RNA helicase